MVSKLFSTALVLSGHLSLTLAAGNPLFAAGGQGYIHVIAGGDVTKANPSNRIGCMSESGAFTLDDCGVFTRVGDNGLTSPLGNCTFNDDLQPANTDAVYGQRNYAWTCRDNADDGWIYYMFDGEQPIIWHGNLNPYEDAKTIPKAAGDKLPIWSYSWGSTQTDVPPGHTKTMWLWVPDNGTSSGASR